MADYSSTDDGLRWWAAEKPNKEFIVFEGVPLTFAEADSWVDRAAHFLSEQGLRPGHRFGVIGPNSVPWAIASLAAIRVGAIHAALSERSVANEVRSLTEFTETRIVVAADTHRGIVEQALEGVAGSKILPLSAIDALQTGPSKKFIRPDIENANTAIIVYSSGSTGLPKGIAHSMAGLLSHMHEWALTDPAMGHEARIVGVLPLSPQGGFINQILRPSVTGGTVYLMPKFDEREVLQLLTEEKCSSLMAPPLIFQRISALPEFQSADLSSLTYAIVGGAPVPLDEFAKWFDRGASLRQTYGSTEAGGHFTVTPLADCRAGFAGCGRGNMFRKIKVVRPDGSECRPGEDGEILIRGPSIMQGYWNNKEATDAVLKDGWVYSGDLGHVDENGVMRVTDRIKEVIITGGFNVGPTEVENALMEFPGVEEVAVIGLPDKVYGEGIGAIISSPHKLLVDDIIAHCRDRLAGYKVPRYVLVLQEKLPRSEQGKFAKVEMRKRFGDALAMTLRQNN